MRLYKEQAGIISEEEIWIFIDKCWMYENESLLRLIYIIITEWRHDRHLIG